MLLLALLATIMAPVVLGASCDNACSGHGTCGQNGVCTCFDNWGVGLGRLSGDCSERICPFEFAWVDTPDKLGNHHKYAECSNRGICDRETGECECFPGYEGKACARTSCPNDCSGHGRCKEIQDLPFQVTPMQYDDGSFLAQKAHTFANSYYKWDADKTRGCVCDPEYGDVDCSKRMCMYGNDIMDQRDNLENARRFHVQHILFVADVPDDYNQDKLPNDNNVFVAKTIALTFTSKLNESFTTMPIVMDRTAGADGFPEFVKQVEYALESLPNKVIDDVHVAGNWFKTTTSNDNWAEAQEAADAHNDDTAGNALRHPTDITDTTADATGSSVNTYKNSLYLNITFTGENVQGPQNLITVKHIKCDDGCTPKLTGIDLWHDTMRVTDITNDGITDYNSYECGRRGKCDYSTGMCECFSGYTGLSCGTITSLV